MRICFATFAKQSLVENIRYNFEICERIIENAKENCHAFGTFAEGILATSFWRR